MPHEWQIASLIRPTSYADECVLTHSRIASFTRVCQPGPVAFSAASTSASKRIVVGTFSGARPGPRLRVIRACAAKASTAASLFGSYGSTSASNGTGASASASRFTRGQSVLLCGFIHPPFSFRGAAQRNGAHHVASRHVHQNQHHAHHLDHRDIRHALLVVAQRSQRDFVRRVIDQRSVCQVKAVLGQVGLALGFVVSDLEQIVLTKDEPVKQFVNTLDRALICAYAFSVAGKQPAIGFGDLSWSGEEPRCSLQAAFFMSVCVPQWAGRMGELRGSAGAPPVRQPVRFRPPVWRRAAVRKSNWSTVMNHAALGAPAPTVLSFESTSVRTFADEHGEPWFSAADVCDVLGYVNSRQAVQKNCRPEGVSSRDTLTAGGVQEMTFINEGNLYRLIIKSRKPEAKPFRKWVTSEVLPTIRQIGRYQATPYTVAPGDRLS